MQRNATNVKQSRLQLLELLRLFQDTLLALLWAYWLAQPVVVITKLFVQQQMIASSHRVILEPAANHSRHLLTVNSIFTHSVYTYSAVSTSRATSTTCGDSILRYGCHLWRSVRWTGWWERITSIAIITGIWKVEQRLRRLCCQPL